MSVAAEIDRLIAALDLQPHPEGGWYREMLRIPASAQGRSPGTAIYYLLDGGRISRWHRVDAHEVWHHYAGAPLRLSLADEEGVPVRSHLMGPDVVAGQRPQAIVPPHVWQSAESLGGWTLCGCTVSPGFEFAGFEMAPEGWRP